MNGQSLKSNGHKAQEQCCFHIPLRKASEITGLDVQTLRKLADEGKIKSYRTPAGQRKINLNSIQNLIHSSSSP